MDQMWCFYRMQSHIGLVAKCVLLTTINCHQNVWFISETLAYVDIDVIHYTSHVYTRLYNDISGKIRLNDATIETRDITASNGVIQIIDSVLLPDRNPSTRPLASLAICAIIILHVLLSVF